jgi:hypothetical protein
MMHDIILLSVQAALSLVLTIAAAAKIFSPSVFRAALEGSGIPGRSSSVLIVAVPAAELVLAVTLLIGTPASVRLAILGTTTLLAIFTGWIAFVVGRGRALPCGCFGNSRKPMSQRTIFRNVLLTSIAGAGSYMAWDNGAPVPLADPVGIMTAAGLVTLTTMAVAYRAARPALTLFTDDLQNAKAQRGGHL